MFNVSGVQPTPAKKGNAGRRRYSGQSGGGNFAQHLANAVAAAGERQDGFSQKAGLASQKAREDDIRTLWQRVQRTNAEITTLLADRKDKKIIW